MVGTVTTKRFLSSPTPLAFFGFLLAFMLTIAWRMPLSSGQPVLAFGSAAEAAQPAAPLPPGTIPLPPAPEPPPIPQPILVAPPVAPVPVAQAAMLLPNAPVAAVEAAPAKADKKKGRHARKGPKSVDARATTYDLAGMMSAATDGAIAKKRGR